MVTTLLDSGSKINILSKRVGQKLGWRGETVIIDTIGVGGMSTQQVTKKVNVVIEDQMVTVFQAIILDKVCGDALPITENILMKICKGTFKYYVTQKTPICHKNHHLQCYVILESCLIS